eukprot:TRINITY_DN55579_c0_g1_i1.p1 TRINITY_DN55579_c0_g1~~TRINITY_DN55579_c0_g1_i1.p1  ORF type:complete len:380 (+),score=47.11 TRINITY_DN55579_c0_g1_i1:54-1193(+)
MLKPPLLKCRGPSSSSPARHAPGVLTRYHESEGARMDRTMSPSSPDQERDWSVTELIRDDYEGEVELNLAPLETFFMHSAVCCVRYSADGAALIAGGNHYVRIFGSDTGELITSLPMNVTEDSSSIAQDNHCRAACFSPHGEYAVTSSDGDIEKSVNVWNYEESCLKYTFYGHSASVCGLDVSSDGRFVASADCEGHVKLWQLESGELLSTLQAGDELSDAFTSVAISASKRHVVAGCLDKTIKLWDVETSQLVSEYDGHSNSVYSVWFTSDGGGVLSGSLDGTAKVWDLSDSSRGHCQRTLRGHDDFVLAVTISPDDQWLITGSKDRSVRFWDARREDVAVQLCGHSNSVISVAHDPSTNRVATASGDRRLRTWVYEG